MTYSTLWRLLAAGSLLAGLVWYVRPAELASVLGQTDAGLVGAAVGLGLVGLGLQWIKWHALLRWARPHTRWGESLDSLLVGFALGLVSPGRLGELGRGLYLGGERALWAGLAGVDRLVSALVTLGFGGLALALWRPRAVGLVILGGLLVMGAGLVGRRALRGLAKRWGVWAQVLQGVSGLPRALWWATVFWSVWFNLVFFCQFYLILLSWGPVAPVGRLAIPMLFALKSLVPFSLLDVGVREGAAVLIFSWLGLPPSTALGAALIVFAINVLGPGLAGATLLYRRGWTAFKRPVDSGQAKEN